MLELELNFSTKKYIRKKDSVWPHTKLPHKENLIAEQSRKLGLERNWKTGRKQNSRVSRWGKPCVCHFLSLIKKWNSKILNSNFVKSYGGRNKYL